LTILAFLSFTLPRHCLCLILNNGTSHLLLAHTVTQEDPWISYRGVSGLCSPLGLVPHSFPPVEALEFRASGAILVPLLCSLKNYGIVGSALPTVRFLIIDLIEQGHLLIVGGPVVFWILWSLLVVCLDVVIIGVSYATLELCFRLWRCLQRNPRNASIKHEHEKPICNYNIIVKRKATK
jgi:hypothetical protein